MRLKTESLQCVDAGIYEGKEKEEETIIVHDTSRNYAFTLDWSICRSRIFVGHPLLSPSRVNLTQIVASRLNFRPPSVRLDDPTNASLSKR
jgi:hypothetical protein